jgi:hypothetical protein
LTISAESAINVSKPAISKEIMRHISRSELHNSNYKTNGTVRILAAVIFWCFFGIGIHKMYFSETGQQPRTNATVVDNREIVMGRGTGDERTIYAPVLEYEIDGEIYTTDRGVRASTNKYGIGQQVEVTYDPSTPDIIYQPLTSRLYATLLFISLIGTTGTILLIKTIMQIRNTRRGLHPKKDR